MKLLPKFALLSIGVAAVPLAIAGYSSIRVSQAALREAIEDHEDDAAASAPAPGARADRPARGPGRAAGGGLAAYLASLRP